MPTRSKNELAELVFDAAYRIVEEAELYSLHGDLWSAFFALRLAEDDNPLGLAAEMSESPRGSIVSILSHELWEMYRILTRVKNTVEADPALQSLRSLANYTPSTAGRAGVKGEVLVDVLDLSRKIADAELPSEMCEALSDFYTARGSGVFALHCAFRWGDGKLKPVSDLYGTDLDSLIGYEAQKKELRMNTEMFLRGGEANNVLLFGDSGTGKSSSVRALLNEPGYVRRGLRMIEIHKDQFPEIPDILDTIRNRNYRFILFLDDLSFEEFETEYKCLKAVIEGGVACRPKNAVIYATSNRRNLVREVWADRRMKSDDVHGGDTMQEKMSLADRFGLTVWYGAASKDEYLKMILGIASEFGIQVDPSEMEMLAMRWELGKGGFTGRAARQFVQYLSAGAQGGRNR